MAPATPPTCLIKILKFYCSFRPIFRSPTCTIHLWADILHPFALTATDVLATTPGSTQWPRVCKTLSSMHPVQLVSWAYRVSTSLLCMFETRLFVNFGPGLTTEKPEPLDN